MEVFRCGCGKGFDLEDQPRKREIECSNCGARWRFESSGGRFRIYEWKD